MKDIVKIIKLIGQILIKPKKTSYSSTLTDYNMKTMKIFIVFVSISVLAISQLTKFNEVSKLELILAEIIMIVVLLLIMTKFITMLFRSIINSVIDFNIPFNMMEKILMPYITTYVVIASPLLFINVKNMLINYLANIVLLTWLNMQVYYVAIYRVKNKEMNKDEKIKIFRRLSVIIIIVILLVIPIYYANMENHERGYKYSYQNPEIRKEVYSVCLEVYSETQKIMTRGQGVSQQKKEDLFGKMTRITYKVNSLRENESTLIGYIREMIKANQMWYEAKLNNDKKTMEQQLNLYYSYEKEAKILMETYKEVTD